MNLCSPPSPSPSAPPFSERVKRHLGEIHICVYTYTYTCTPVYTCVGLRVRVVFTSVTCLLPRRLACNLTMITRLTANFYTSAILRPFIILQRRDDDTRIYNFCTPPITCPPSPHPPPPLPPPSPPSLRPLPSCLVSNFVTIQRNLFLRLLSTRSTNFCFRVVSLILFQRRDDDTGICNVCTRQLRGRPPPSPPALRPLLLCLISDYVRIERNLSLCLLSTRNICVFALSCVIYFNVAMMMLVFATVALRQFRVRPPPLRPLPSCFVSNFVTTERNVSLRLLSTRNTTYFFAWLRYAESAVKQADCLRSSW